jgi:hypothetical protein
MIDAKATETEIKEWKNHPSVKRCYTNLFKKVNNEETNMSMIIDKAWRDKKNTPRIHIAYAISVCEVFLNPSNLIINMSEEVVKPYLTKNYVSF